MIIAVTQAHIDAAIKWRNVAFKPGLDSELRSLHSGPIVVLGVIENCPVAYALDDTIGHPCWVNYDCWGEVESNLTVPLAERVSSRIAHWDQTGEMEPFSFEAEV